MKVVLKIGGNELDDPSFLKSVASLAAEIRRSQHELILVHGGGKEITGFLTQLGLETKFVSGFRFTDPKTLEATEMMLSGVINKRIVKSLQQKGVDAIGLSGVDGRILVAERTRRNGEDVGFVGNITRVNTSLLEELTRSFALVLSPISVSEDSSTSLNVNADYATAAVASSLKAELTVFLSNVPGVLAHNDVIGELDEKEFLKLKALGVIAGGMIPKIEAALLALRGGSAKTFIADAEGASEIVSGQNAGTRLLVDGNN